MKNTKPVETTEEKKVLIPYERVSDPSQAKENKTGLERQFESAHRTLLTHPNWEIDETFSLIDPGKSGYHGKNLDPEAALGGFLKALREGKIPLTPKKVLHIDDMARLSRLPIRRARRLFEDILEAGVEIYDAEDSKLYTEASLDDLLDLIISLVRHEGAHKHSKNLAEKVSKSFTIRKQRLKDTGKAYRYRTHAWLRWVETGKTDGYYEEIKEKSRGVKRLFELGYMGLGQRGITKRLNEEKLPILGTYNGKKIKSVRWNITSVRRIIMNQAVIGMNENVDPPVKMYPVIIDPKIYWAVRGKIESRAKQSIAGRNADTGTNLFSGLTACAHCNSSMHYHQQKRDDRTRRPETFGSRGGIGSHGGIGIYPYYICAAYNDGPCTAKQIRYDWTEESFIVALSRSVEDLTLASSKEKDTRG